MFARNGIGRRVGTTRERERGLGCVERKAVELFRVYIYNLCSDFREMRIYFLSNLIKSDRPQSFYILLSTAFVWRLFSFSFEFIALYG